jgi:aminoglycoside phosphotransferase (APT) family kinase protein
MLTIPCQLEALTTDWLAHALDAPVSGFQVEDAHSGTTGRGVIRLAYEESADLPARLFVKLPPTDEMQRLFVTANGMGRREAMFYESLSAEVPLRVPRSYFAASDDTGEAYIMLLEHLEDTGCTFGNASSRYSLDYIRQVLDEFAQLHAAYWDSPRFATDLAWVEPPPQHDAACDLIAQALEQHAGDMPGVFREMGELYIAEADGIHAIWGEGVPTLIHGDVHDANLFFDNGRPGFLDWALVGCAPAMRDVGYFLAGTLSVEDQPEHGPAMLSYYRERLLAAGVDAPPMEMLWRQYQWHAAYVWVGA